MHYFDDGADVVPMHLARPEQRQPRNGADQAGSRQFRRPGPGEQARKRQGRLMPPPAAGPEHPQAAREHPPALSRSMRTWRMPVARPPADSLLAASVLPASGTRDAVGKRANGAAPASDRPFQKIADGLAITPRVSVVLPVMNEAANLPGVFATLPSWITEVVLVDGRSTDNTIEVARRLRPDVKVVLQGGVGKGDALAAGFAAASGDIIVAIDGDGSTDGGEIVRFVSALLAGADFAKGSRFNSSGRSDDITAIRRYGNKMLNVTVNRLFRTNFSDLCYGYNAFWAHHLDQLALDSPGFEIETLMSIRAARAGLRIYEVPSHERPRLHGATNLSAAKDGWRILRLIAAEKKAAGRRKARRPKPFLAPGRLAQHDDVQEASASAPDVPGSPRQALR